MNNSPLFNLSILEEMEDNDFVVQIISLYLKDSAQNVSAIKQAADNSDFKSVEQKVHKLKGSTGMLQSEPLMTTINNLHESSKADNSNGSIKKLVDQMLAEYEALQEALNNYIETFKK
ncbi:MAG: hypothetical protein NVSMB45_16770 [Ginsengibacter sp.]